MKNLIILIATVSLILSFTSCETSFLDSESYSDLIKENYYSSLTEYETALVGCYYYISGRGNERDGCYISGIPIMGQAGTDETFIASKGSRFEYANHLDTYSFLNANNKACEEIWKNHYTGINATNEIINRIDNMDIVGISSEPRHLGIKAEAQFLQALWYFNMARIYGGVPIITKGFNSLIDYNAIKRDSLEKVYNHIVVLLDSAKKYLPESVTEYGRATKYSAYALESKVALHIASSMNLLSIPDEVKLGGINSYDWFAKDASGNILSKTETIKHYYQMALDNANVVLTHFAPSYLMPKFTDCFYPSESSKEILFEGVMSAAMAKEQGGYFGSLYGPPGSTIAGGGQQVIMPINPIVLDHFTYTYTGTATVPVYSSVDDRFLWTIATYKLNANSTKTQYATTVAYKSFTIGKFKVDAPSPYNQDRTPVNNPILRVSDICLVYAEAQAELDNFAGLGITSNALKFLNVVRKRALLPDYTDATVKAIIPLSSKTMQGNKQIKGYTPITDIEFFRNAILNERMLELLGEGHRWFDLVRMGVLLPIATEAATYANPIDLKTPIRSISTFHIFRPIPAREISLHKGSLIQNYGYN